jgi:hypothetical protein
MSKLDIYKELIANSICKFGDFRDGKNFNFNYHKLMANPNINLKVLEYIGGKLDSIIEMDELTKVENSEWETDDMDDNGVIADVVRVKSDGEDDESHSASFKRIIASYPESYIFATDIAVSNSKGLMIPNIGPNLDCEHVSFPDIFDINEPVALVVHMLTRENHEQVAKLVKMLRDYGATVAYLVEIFSCNSGYELPLVLDKENPVKHISIFSISELCDAGEANNMLDPYFTEKFKFNAETNTKLNAAKYS